MLEAIAGVPRETLRTGGATRHGLSPAASPLGHGEAMMKPVLQTRALQALRCRRRKKRIGDRHRQRLPDDRLPGHHGPQKSSASNATPDLAEARLSLRRHRQ